MSDLATNLRTWLDAQDGYQFAGTILFAFVALCLACALVNAIARANRQQPRIPARLPVSSNRKASR